MFRDRLRVILPVAAVVVVVAVVAALLLWPSGDPRPAFAADAGRECTATGKAIGDLQPPSADPTARLDLYVSVAAANDELAARIQRLDAPGDAEPLQKRLVEIIASRSTTFNELALDDAVAAGTFEDAVTKLTDAWSASYADALDVLAEWDPETPCATLPVAGTGAVQAAGDYTATLGELCGNLTESLTALDAKASDGDLDRDAYLDEVAATLRTFHDDTADVPAHPLQRVVDAFEEWRAVIPAAVDAVEAGDTARVAELNAAWAAAATKMEVPDCGDGVAVSTTSPSGFLAAPSALPVDARPSPTNRATFGPWVIETLRARAGVDPDTSFGLSLAVTGLFDGAHGVSGAELGTGSAVSISAAMPVVASDKASEENPYIVAVAFESDGACVWGRMWGYPKLTGFAEMPVTGPCTGDAALAAALADAAENPPVSG